MSSVGKIVRDPNKTADSSQCPPHNCSKCGNPVDGLYCRGCALLRKKLKEVWSTICYEVENFQDFLDISESSNDKTNVVLPQEPFVFNQDPSESSSQSPPHIDHHCCYECGDSLDDIFCQRCTYSNDDLDSRVIDDSSCIDEHRSSSTSPNFFLEETNTFDNSLLESETFCFNLEEKSSGSTTILSDYSLSDYEAFYLDDDLMKSRVVAMTIFHEEFVGDSSHHISIGGMIFSTLRLVEAGNFTMDVVEDIFNNLTREPRVHVPNVLTTHPTLHLDSDFTLSSDSLGSDLVVSFPSGTRNKIFDPGIFIGVQSMRFLSLDEFSISFIRDLLFPVIDTFLPFSPQNEDKVVNPDILASNEETSPHLLSHRGFNPSKIISDFSESPMMIYGGDIPILDVPFLHFYPP
ncbi:hypothetical protein Tco_0983079 [Tanacetum coccineum]